MDYIKKFIESNRQTGSTTALVRAVRETRGYLIVSTMDVKANLLHKHDDLKNHIYTISEIKSGSLLGRKMGCIFFDTDAVWSLSQVVKPPVVVRDGYTEVGGDAINALREAVFNIEQQVDGYAAHHNKQVNVKLTEEDMKELDLINKEFFEGEAGYSLLGRILLRKGIHFYERLRNSLDKHSL